MHIGMLTACYAPVVNGVTQMVASYEKHLTAAGHRVTTFTLGRPAPSEDTECVIRSPGIDLGRTGYHVAPRYSREAQRALRRVDVLHCHHPLMGLEFARRYAHRPIVFTSHTRYDLYLHTYTRLPRWLVGQVLNFGWPKLARWADTVIAPSASMAKLLRDFGVEVPIVVIENGVDLERFQLARNHRLRAELLLPGDAFVLIYVGRVAPEKNVQRLLDEFRLAASQCDELHLVVVGGGPPLGQLVKMAEEHGLSNRVRFVGPVDPTRVPAYLAASDAFISASVTEVHPLTVIEALVAGLPVLAIDSPGMSDIVSAGLNGILASGSSGNLAQAMSRLAGNCALHKQLAAGARVSGRRYDARKTVERTVTLYRHLLDQSNEKSRPGQEVRVRREGELGRRRQHRQPSDSTWAGQGGRSRE